MLTFCVGNSNSVFGGMKTSNICYENLQLLIDARVSFNTFGGVFLYESIKEPIGIDHELFQRTGKLQRDDPWSVRKPVIGFRRCGNKASLFDTVYIIKYIN